MENKIYSVEVEDRYEPLEEGLDVVIDKRSLVCMDVMLSLSNEDLD